jgi:hypothetical protein
VVLQAAGFALLAAISPTALLVMAVFLGSDNPRRIVLLYFAGAVLMTVIMAVTVLIVLRSTGMNQPREHAPRYGLRLGLGILALAVAAVLAVRAARAGRAPAPDPGAGPGKAPKPGMIGRLTARPRPLTGFLAGLLLFVPSTMFIAAVQVIATARAPVAETVLATVIVTLLTVLTVWLPFVTYLAAPGATTHALRFANSWLVAHGRMLVLAVLTVTGAILVVNGALNL